ncbi:hypothetical protein J2X32_003776 [Rheinheimera pacifica]|uniref:hypothetical protein n=1 Tax=Rheinheimera pacifica TaxID=173990 RepID=UPI002861FE9A|nr:hypothetical protein [Rheinheimera pacifica]MDR6985119.1 hypothetical protein [Rheinheimera pacifica]
MKKILVTLTLMLCGISFNTAAAGSVDAGDINFLLFYKGHSGLLIKHQYQIDADNCGRRDYYILPDNHPHFSQIYALLLAAQTAGKKVSFNTDGCHEGIPAIVHVGLAKQ